MAPIHAWLSLALVLLALEFFEELVHYFASVFSRREAGLVLVGWLLIARALIGGLLAVAT